MKLLNFNEFTDYVREHIVERMETSNRECEVYIQKITKNNGVVLTALQILENGDNCTPSIYLEPYYQKYREDMPLEEILEEMMQFYYFHKDEMEITVESLSAFQSMKDKIIMRLVNYERNEEQLRDCPHIRWHDLAITFRWLAHSDDIGIATALVTNREVALWETSLEELHALAVENMPRIFPCVIQSMKNVLLEHLSDNGQNDSPFLEPEEQTALNMYVITNEQRINGATSILYSGILEAFAKRMKADIYMLPSSIHEMILIPKESNMQVSELKNMVINANMTVVEDGEMLSNHVYLYSQGKNAVAMY